MHRRKFLHATGALGLVLATTRARAQGVSTLKFVPAADLAVLDPIITSAYVTRNHALMVFDTLYGLDSSFRPQPQMVAGHVIEDGGKTWTMTLREGLRFHDNTPVLARDAVASLQRWASRDAFGAVFNAALEEITPLSDRAFRIKLKKPFPTLLDGFAHCSTLLMPIMPERLAKTPGTTAITEMVGSGPYRFVASERVPGSLAVYSKFDGYVPRQDPPSFLAGAKIAHIERIEWHTIPDAATAASALRSGEVDWWEQPTIDLLPQLRSAPGVTAEVTDKSGNLGILRLNHLHPPFDNPAVRRVVLAAAVQSDFMTAVVGEDKSLWKDGVGVFTPDTPLANDAGMKALAGPRDYDKIKKDLAAAGYKGERVVMLAATDFPSINAMCEVAGDMYRKMGMNLDYQSVDWGTVVQRRNSQEPVEKGGWSTHCTYATGYDSLTPANNQSLNAVGRAGFVGWCDSPKLTALRAAWFDAPDLAAQQKLAREIQEQFLQDVPYVPTGQFLQPTAYRSQVKNMVQGSAVLFFGLQK
jgi:peptide/nickel transport system substrate-binding protein